MSDMVIRVDELSKRYRLGAIGRQSFTDALRRRFLRQTGASGEPKEATSHSSQEFWALQKISFELKAGEVLGVIGGNGAGKSTLLKILSRITEPSSGRALIRGRVGSLLEVGTGFHPELTGRDNIFMSGTILGMRRKEIKDRFDEIVAFSGIEAFIDTPVKRYSSGMYVRLAFAVAAHLEPEILIVDEVLAVGDAEFQKRCLGKMEDVASHGRTVLFVSHNMAAVSRLCSSCLYLKEGQLRMMGGVEATLHSYLSEQRSQTEQARYVHPEEQDEQGPHVLQAWLRNDTESPAANLNSQQPFYLDLLLHTGETNVSLVLSILLKDELDRRLSTKEYRCIELPVGEHSQQRAVSLKFPPDLLFKGNFSFDIVLHIPNQQIFQHLKRCCSFEILEFSEQSAAYNNRDVGIFQIHPEALEQPPCFRPSVEKPSE